MAEKPHSKTDARVGNWLARAPSWLAGVTLFALMVMTFLDVVLRSAFNNPIEAATELTRLFMAIIVFASLPVISWRDEHIAVDLLDTWVSGRLERWRDAVVFVISGALLLWPAWRIFQLAGRAWRYGDMTEYLHIPQFYIAYFIAASTLITAAVFIARGVLALAAPQFLHRRGEK